MQLEALVWLTAFLAYFVAIPAITFINYERTHRHRWRRFEHVLVPATAHTPFREVDPTTPWHAYTIERHGAPNWVKVVVVTSLVLGHMFLPGLVMGLFGLMAMGIGLVSIPGLVLAARIYANAFAILRNDPLAATEARALRIFAWVLNVVVIIVAGGLVVATPELWALSTFMMGYAMISLLHAEALGWVASAIDRAHREVEAEGASASARSPDVGLSASPAVAQATVHSGPWA